MPLRLHRFPSSMILRLVRGLLWCLLHLVVEFVHFCSYVIQQLQICIVSCGWVPEYQHLQLNRLKHLAVVVDSEEAKNILKVKELLCWLSSAGVKYAILYDIEGVLKKSIAMDLKNSVIQSIRKSHDIDVLNGILLCDYKGMMIELLSYSDGKQGVAKATNLLCSNYLGDGSKVDNETEPIITETDMANALQAVGYGGPDPDLLLVYGPARCHLGFPPWRLQYTEIMHMGPLNFMKFGAIVKTLYDFSKKHQNYGT